MTYVKFKTGTAIHYARVYAFSMNSIKWIYFSNLYLQVHLMKPKVDSLFNILQAVVKCQWYAASTWNNWH